jgi:hypothetical protein
MTIQNLEIHLDSNEKTNNNPLSATFEADVYHALG